MDVLDSHLNLIITVHNKILRIYLAFQSDNRWKIMKFSTDNNVIENVIKLDIQFDGFPNQEVIVKDLTVHACISGGMCANVLDSLYCYYYYFRHSILYYPSIWKLYEKEIYIHKGCSANSNNPEQL